MSTTLTQTSSVRIARRGRQSIVTKILRDPLAIVSAVFIALVLAVGLLAPLIAPVGPNITDLSATNAPPFSPGHLLGGDGSGRDIFSRLVWGTQQTLFACVVILTVSLLVGGTAGLIAGFYRGPFESAASWVSDVIMSMPGIVLLIALYALTGPNLPVAMMVFGLLVSPAYYRLVRTLVLGVRGELYVDAARVAGIRDIRIISRHILFAVRPPVIVQSAFVLASGIGIEAAVGFLGLGDPRAASWGGMLQEAFRNIYNNGIAVLWPSLLIGLTTLAFILLGNALRDAVQPTGEQARSARKTRKRRLEPRRTPAPEANTAPHATTATSDHLLSVSGLRLGYPDSTGAPADVVHGVDLTVNRGEIRGLIGESGSGKSQTAFAVLGILPSEAVITGGSIVFDGNELLGDSQAQGAVRGRRIAYIPQEPLSNLDPSYTVGAQLTQGLRATRRIGRSEARREIITLMNRVGIRNSERVFDQYPHEISGGMAQRILICGAVASDPDLIIADEPTTALDVTVQAGVLALLRELRDERGLGMVLVTHNFGVVADICDTVSVMQAGRIVETADVRTIFREPHHAYTQELLAASRRVDSEGHRA